ncbi:MAG: B12-binding domain-containing protein [Dehalococcoidia bacterium]
MNQSLSQAVVDLKEEEVAQMVEERLQAGADPMELVEECRQGMTQVGERYETKEYFLSDLIMAAEIFKDAMARIEPRLSETRQGTALGKIVLGTPQGDIHDIGKNIAAVLLRAWGFEVFDLGTDVPPAQFVERLQETGASLLGMSALITPTFEAMKETVEAVKRAGLRERVSVLIGGGVTTPEVKRYVGADFQTRDAMEAVAMCQKLVSGG